MSNESNFSRHTSNQSSTLSSVRTAGIHLSGPNANKTALVFASGNPRHAPVEISQVYEKIGAYGTLFSDDRLVELLLHHGPFAAVFVDCPLTLPPCVACQRPVCPGAVQCDDVAVAYMLAISSRVRKRGARKARPVNPQSQRVWDVMQLSQDEGEAQEPTYSANLAPLVTRARTLQRRLNALSPRIELLETQVANAIEFMREPLGLPDHARQHYRRFETGLAMRQGILTAMVGAQLLAPMKPSLCEQLCGSVEVFHAFIAVVVASMQGCGLTQQRPDHYRDVDGWVYLPDMSIWPSLSVSRG